MADWETLYTQMGVRFQREALLDRALTHRSYVNEHADAVEDNERLEYLGDAVIDLIVADLLFTRYPGLDEGALTRLRASLVRTENLAALAVQLNLGELLRMGRGERLTGGAQRQRLLCATFEALAGALYLDQGFEVVQRVLGPMFVPRLPADEAALMNVLDAKSRFQEWAQAELGLTPRYVTVDSNGPEHELTFTVSVQVGETEWGRGEGKTKQQAAQQAARAALGRVRELAALAEETP